MASSQLWTSNYLQQFSGTHLVVTSSVFLVLDVAFVALRFFARRLQRQKLSWDDWLLVPSLLAMIASIVVTYLAVYDGGIGHHLAYIILHRDLFINTYKYSLIALPITYAVSMSLPKISILGLYLHILRDRPSRWVAYGTMFAIVVNLAVMLVVITYKCHPISYGWLQYFGEQIPGAWCVDASPRMLWGSFVNIITDAIMVVLPVPLLWRVQMNKVSKLGLSLMFALGSAGIITSCLRFAAFYNGQLTDDSVWTSGRLLVWCIVEPSIYLMAACVLSFGHLTSRLFDIVTTSFSRIRSQEEASSHSTPQDVEEKPRRVRGWFSMDKSLFTTQASELHTTSDSSTNVTLMDDGSTHQKHNVIRVKRSFDVESCAMDDSNRSYI